MFICTAGAAQGANGFIGATMVMDLYFKAINTDYCYNLFADHTDQCFVGDRPELLQKAFEMGEEIARG